MTRALRRLGLGLLIGLVGVTAAHASLINQPVPDNATFIQGSLQWAWASPVAGDGSFGSGGLDLSYQGTYGWRIPIGTDLLSLPSALDFVFAGANVPLGGTDPVSLATFHYDSTRAGDAACAAPYFNNTFYHCDWGNAPGSGSGNGVDIVPWWPDAGFVSYSESLVVRDYSAPVPEPGTLALLGLGIAGLGLRRRR